METVGTTKAASLLGICPQRVRQLLAEGRVKGAYKQGRFWRIPLYKRMPRINSGTRGPEGTWRKYHQRATTDIYVNSTIIKSNINKEDPEPVIGVHQGIHTNYCHEVEILGSCLVKYSPNKPKGCGARVWIEVAPDVEIIRRTFTA
ncbi:MAG: helix-turn-helix domain-containing protein [Crocosphaera sp.]